MSFWIRMGFTAMLLFIAGHHSHWSVALILTLMAINSEITAYLLKNKRDK